MGFTNKHINENKRYQQYMYSYPHKSAYEFSPRLDLAAYQHCLVGRTIGLYLHIPFCHRKCGYCNLFSVTKHQDQYPLYVEAIKRHSLQLQRELNLRQTTIDSFTLGGGTPLLLSPSQLYDLFDFFQQHYFFSLADIFSGIESSPTAISAEKLALLEEFHWKRLSIGIQSFVDQELALIERGESYASSIKALELVRQHHFSRLNLDLIYGIPNQSVESFIYSLRQALVYQPEEIFLYPLYKQVNARLYHKFTIDEQKQYELYQVGRDLLLAEGYFQLSMRSFAKTKDLNGDCGFENTLAIGCGGRTYLENLHFCEPYVALPAACEHELQQYLHKEDFLAALSFYQLDLEEQKRRYLIKNLLYFTGLSLEDYQGRFKGDVWQDFPLLEELIAKEYASFDQETERIYLTKLGMGLSDRIGPAFISEQVKAKMK